MGLIHAAGGQAVGRQLNSMIRDIIKKGDIMELRIILPASIIILIIILGVSLHKRLQIAERRMVLKDKYYDQATKEYDTKRKGVGRKPINISSISTRLYTLYLTFVFVVALYLFFFGIDHGNALIGIGLALLSVVASPFVLLVFPLGVDMFFDPTSHGILGYFLYFLILWFTIFFDDHYFTYIYLIFVIILILNVIGFSNIDLSWAS